MAPASLPQYTGWLGGIFLTIVALVTFFKRFKAVIMGAVRFFVAVGQVADLDTRLLKVEKEQVSQPALDSIRLELAQKIDRVEDRLMEVNKSNHVETMNLLGDQWKKIDEFITTITFLTANGIEARKRREENKNAETDRPIQQQP